MLRANAPLNDAHKNLEHISMIFLLVIFSRKIYQIDGCIDYRFPRSIRSNVRCKKDLTYVYLDGFVHIDDKQKMIFIKSNDEITSTNINVFVKERAQRYDCSI